MKTIKVLIDNGHGEETPGKRSPDGRLREYAYAREIANRVVSKLQEGDSRFHPLQCSREWRYMDASGWRVFVGGNASQNSKRLALKMAEAAISKKVKVCKPCPQTLYWTADLYICRKTNCPAVLVENFFQDNKKDVEFLLSEAGKQCVTDIMVEGVLGYLKE